MSIIRTTTANPIITEEKSYSHESLESDASNVSKLNNDQRKSFEAIIESTTNDWGNSYFIDGPGGHGKTFLFNTILATVRLSNKIALAVASSGIASILLSGGRTAHNRFKIPLNLFHESTCNIAKNTFLADLIKETKLIIWDEAPMSHRYAIEAVNRTLQDICNNNLRFGGITVVFGGDFRQILPVIPNATNAEIIDACINKSNLWRYFNHFQLCQNMRLDPASQERSDFLLSVAKEEYEHIQI